MSELFYIQPSERAGLNDGVATLLDAEARHLTRVMRKKVGNQVDLFDGSGVLYHCEITAVARDRVELDVLDTIEENREPNVAVTAIVALPKGDRQKWAIEKLTELGVTRFIPLQAERADVQCDADTCERLRRQTLEASKQCRRLRLMQILPAVAPKELPALVEILQRRLHDQERPLSTQAQALYARLNADDLFHEFRPGDDVLRIVAHPICDGQFGQTSFSTLIRQHGQIPRGALILVGPVGGFSDAEVADAVRQGWAPLDLGKQVYRVETAAIVAAALLTHLD